MGSSQRGDIDRGNRKRFQAMPKRVPDLPFG